jgi:hypothetical protein
VGSVWEGPGERRGEEFAEDGTERETDRWRDRLVFTLKVKERHPVLPDDVCVVVGTGSCPWSNEADRPRWPPPTSAEGVSSLRDVVRVRCV